MPGLTEKEPEDELLCVLASSGPGGAYSPGSRGGRGVPELVWSSRPGIPPGASEGEGCAEMESWKGLIRPAVQAGEWRGGLGKAG